MLKGKYIAYLVSIIMIGIVVVGQIGQYHHHDENDDVCLCLTPSSHCHDSDHHDCNHHTDREDCRLRIEETIINEHDTEYTYQIIYDICIWLAIRVNIEDGGEQIIYPERICLYYHPDIYRQINKRGPPIC